MALHRRLSIALVLCVLASALAWAAPWSAKGAPAWSGAGAERFLTADKVFTVGPAMSAAAGHALEGRIAPGHYLYRHALRLVDRDGSALDLALPRGTPRHDEFFGDTEVFVDPVLALRIPAAARGPLTLHWQGCADAGICYPPQAIEVALPAAVDGLPDATAMTPEPGLTGPAAATGRDLANAGTNAVPVDRPGRATPASPLPPAADRAAPGAAPPRSDAPAAPKPTRAPDDAGALAEDQAAASRLGTLGPAGGALLFLGFGLLLAFTPCTLPMLPIVSGLVVGSGAGPRRAVALSAVYVLAMAATYAAVGVAAGLAGANLQAALQSPWLLGAFAALFLLLAASLFGLFALRLPAFLAQRIDRAGRGRAGGSLPGAAMLGLLSALLVGPCMTAPLAGALLYIGQTGSAATGGLALFALGIGMGVPLVLVAVFGARLLPRPGPWMDRVQHAFGFVMVAMAIVMLARFLPAPVGLLLWGAWALAIAVALAASAAALRAARPAAWTLRFGALLVGLWSTLMLVGAAAGGDSALRPLEAFAGGPAATTAATVRFVDAKSAADLDARIAAAGARGEWTLVDVYADWCVSCHVIEREVFGDPAVAARLARMQVVRPDVTANDAVDQALLRRWRVPGPPTLILVGPDGRERRGQRSVGEIDARGFLARLDAAGVP